MKIFGRAAGCAMIASLLAAAAAAQTFPSYINYQGKLGDASGNPQNGTFSFQFDFFGQGTGGTSLFTDGSYLGITVTNGIYSVQIGSTIAGGIPSSVFQNPETWLQIMVNPGGNLTGAQTLLPRERLTTSPFAFRALTSQGLGTGVAMATYTAGGILVLPYGLSAASGTFSGGVTASSGTFLATGNAQYGLALSTSMTFAQTVTGIGIRWADGSISTTAASGGGGGGGGLASVTSYGSLYGAGTAGSPLGVNSSSVPIFNSNENLILPYGISAASGTFSGGVTASSGTFTTTGNTQYSVQTSSGIEMNAGTLNVASGAGVQVLGSTFSVDSAGNVGIGLNPGAANSRLSILLPAAYSIPYALTIGTGTSGSSTTIVSISSAGVIYSEGGVTYAGDLAEMYPSEGPAQAGDVVMLVGSGRVAVRRALSGAGTLLGVVATRPGVTIGNGDLGSASGRVPVALSGRVPIKVTTENGAIAAGDPLAPSRTRPGYAMRAASTGRVIGVALESFDGRAPESSILCFVNPHTWVNPQDFDGLSRRFDSMSRRLDDLEARLGAPKTNP